MFRYAPTSLVVWTFASPLIYVIPDFLLSKSWEVGYQPLKILEVPNCSDADLLRTYIVPTSAFNDSKV